MFIKKIKSSNGRTYVQVIEKQNRKNVVRQSFGSGVMENEVNALVTKAGHWIKDQGGLANLDFEQEEVWFKKAFDCITAHKLVGVRLLFDKIFDDIGFNTISDELFRDLVYYRLIFPKSKLKTTEYLYRYENKEISEDAIYRYMDKLKKEHIATIQALSYTHTLKILNDKLQVVFYDVTTIYFEIDDEDELRKTGFSKEGKHQHPQIVLGLLVSEGGYPMAYELFEGDKFEGHTMLPVIDAFKEKFGIQQLVVVADSGLLSNKNIEELLSKNYEFIIGARIKSEESKIKDKILKLSLKDGESTIIEKGELKLIIAYSDQRGKKDRYNREKGIRKLEQKIKAGRLTKSAINNKGYNKFLEMEGQVSIKLNDQKIKDDSKWDGLKGYITNAILKKEEILENYAHLWQIEKAFRIAKTELKIRPIFHYKKKRIEAHICLNFAAYKVYKDLERILKLKKCPLSAEKAIEIAKSIFQLELTTPTTKQKVKHLILLNDEQKKLAQIFDFGS